MLFGPVSRYHERMLARLLKMPVLVGAAILGVSIAAYLAVHTFVTRVYSAMHPSKIGDACDTAPSITSSKNQNKTLFITCGGFLE